MARKIALNELKPLDLGDLSAKKLICVSDIHYLEQENESDQRFAGAGDLVFGIHFGTPQCSSSARFTSGLEDTTPATESRPTSTSSFAYWIAMKQ